MTDRIVVSGYDPQWPERFEDLRQLLAPHVAGLALSIEHVGSTAVPGCAAKPIIDLDIVVSEEAAMPELIFRLAGQGYQHEGDLGIQGREAFQSPPAGFEHHLYGVVAGTKPHLDHVLLRTTYGSGVSGTRRLVRPRPCMSRPVPLADRASGAGEVAPWGGAGPRGDSGADRSEPEVVPRLACGA